MSNLNGSVFNGFHFQEEKYLSCCFYQTHFYGHLLSSGISCVNKLICDVKDISHKI